MIRQKHYRDKKFNWGQFKETDEVNVYFPRTKSGPSSKFTNYWHGSYRIITKMSNVTFKVNFGQCESVQVIHVDRTRLNDLKSLLEKQMKGKRKKHYRSKSIRVAAKHRQQEKIQNAKTRVFS